MRLRLSPRLSEVLLVSLAVLIAGCSDTTEPLPKGEVPPHRPAAAADISAKSVLPNMDTYVNSDVANRNYGIHDTLLIQQRSTKLVDRMLVSFPQGAISDSVGADSLVSATLELTIKSAGNDWGTSGRAVALHRMTRDWLEGGATWSCANDVNVGNLKADCPGNTWSMPGTSPPFVTTPVAQSTITNGQSGVVRFDVTSDVRSYLANETPNQGWMLKVAAETQTGTVVFHARESASKPRLVLSVAHQQGVPAQAPDTLASWVYSFGNLDSNTAALPGVFLKNIVIVEFKPSATASQRQAAIDLVHGTVVGGAPARAGEGHYYLRVPDSTQGGGLVSAVQELEALPQVQLATYEFSVEPMYLRPKDDANWSSWHLDRKTLTGQNWAMEAVLGPLAWGCSTGNPSLKVALVDLGFPALPAGHDLEITTHPPPNGINPSAGEHGIGVASVLAAHGNNQNGMTGMMWRADLHGYDVGEVGSQEHAFIGRVFQQIKNAADDGARIVNISLAVLPHWADSTRALAGRGLDSTLSALGARGERPLIVLAAGNFTADADTAGFPRAVNGRNGSQVMVVAASTKDSALMVRSSPIGFGSNYGPLITVAAPGADVFHLTRTGAIDHWDGTSTAAPIVSGIAGLLLSFDSTLQASDLKSLIVDGANAGGWKATRTAGGEHYPIVNAYESLKLAALRPGAPLCHNRVWSEGGAVKVQRAATVEQLFSTGGPSGFLNVFHGGRRIDWTDQGDNEHSAIRDGLNWNQVPDDQRAALPDTAPGGTYRSMGSRDNVYWASANHDGDKLLRMENLFISETDDQITLQTSTNNGATWTNLWSTVRSGSNNTHIEYVWRRAKFDSTNAFIEWTNLDSVAVGVGSGTLATGAQFYPSASKALLEFRTQSGETSLLTDEFQPCPWATQVNGVNTEECRSFKVAVVNNDSHVFEVNLASGHVGELRHLVHAPGVEIFEAGVSEAEDEILLTAASQLFDYERVPRTDGMVGWTFANSHSTQDQCQASWHTIPPGGGDAVQRLRVLTPDMCFSDFGGGTIAPSIVRRASGPTPRVPH